MRAQRVNFENNQPRKHVKFCSFCMLSARVIGVGSLAHQALVGFLAPPGQIAWRSFLMCGFLNGAP